MQLIAERKYKLKLKDYQIITSLMTDSIYNRINFVISSFEVARNFFVELCALL